MPANESALDKSISARKESHIRRANASLARKSRIASAVLWNLSYHCANYDPVLFAEVSHVLMQLPP